MGKTRLKIGGKVKFAAISFERGRKANGALTQTEVFHVSPFGQIMEKLKPNSTKISRRTNQGMETYHLRVGVRCKIVQKIVKKGRTFEGVVKIVVKKGGKIETEEWQGDFPPQFFLT